MWIIPSRRRPESLERLFQSARDTGTTTPARILVDVEDYKDNQSKYIALEAEQAPSNWKFVATQGVTMGNKFRETESWLWGQAKWVGIINDDHYLISKEWDRRLIDQLNGANFVSCNDKWHAPKRLAGAVVYSMPLVKAVGYMFPLNLQHIFHDCVWEMMGQATGCWEVDMSVIVEHRHIMKGDAPTDSTHKRIYNEQRWFSEMEIFNKWQLTMLEPGINAIKKLQKERKNPLFAKTVKTETV